MTKLNRKAVEANLRNKLATQYKERTEQLKAEKAALENKYIDMWERARKAEIERDNLKDQVTQYEDWNRRLLEFMDMSEDDRKAYVENLRKTNELDQIIKKFGLFSDLFSRVFI